MGVVEPFGGCLKGPGELVCAHQYGKVQMSFREGACKVLEDDVHLLFR